MGIQNILLLFFVNSYMDNHSENLGLEYIASSLRADGYCVEIQALSYETADWDKLVGARPDLVGFSVYYLNLEAVLSAVNELKKRLPDVKIVLGGPHITLFGTEVLKRNEQIDFGIVGEGEHTMCKLVRSLNQNESIHNISGLIYHENGQYYMNASINIDDLDKLPFPSRELLQGGSALIATSRGCMNDCSFCTHKKFWQLWRGRTPENITEEIKELYANKQINNFFIMDCSFEDPDIHAERMAQICEKIIESKIQIQYSTSFRATFYRKATPRIRDLLTRSGLTAALVGIESGNNEDLKLYHKGTTVADNHQTFQLFREMNCLMIPSFINFNPYSTIPRLQDNLQFLHEYKQTIRFFTFLDVFMYTPIYEKVKRDKLLLPQETAAYSYNYSMYDSCVKPYRYADERAGFLAGYFKKITQKCYPGLFADLLFYYEKHQLQVWQLERNILDNKHTVLFETHFNLLFNLMERLDDVLFDWISLVVRVVKEEFDSDQIDRYTNEKSYISMLESIRQALFSARRGFLKGVLKRGYSIDRL